MDTDKFLAAYRESRNGANGMFRHPLSRLFVYSDGVRDCAEAGCYWLLDILATELVDQFKQRPTHTFCIVTVDVQDSAAAITGEFEDDDPTPYRRNIDYTDLPPGEWKFYVERDGDNYVCILPTEY